MDSYIFWNEVKRWKKLFFLSWLAWPFIGLASILTYASIVGNEPPFVFSVALIVIWFVGWSRILKRLLALRCPACGQPAIKHPFFYASCQVSALWFSVPKFLNLPQAGLVRIRQPISSTLSRVIHHQRRVIGKALLLVDACH